MTKSDDNNAMECRVGLAVAASVEPMPVGLARGSRYGIDTAQGGEGSLGVEAVRVTPGSNEEGRRRVWSYAEAIHRVWGCRPCESLDLGLQVLYLITEALRETRDLSDHDHLLCRVPANDPAARGLLEQARPRAEPRRDRLQL